MSLRSMEILALTDPSEVNNKVVDVRVRSPGDLH